MSGTSLCKFFLAVFLGSVGCEISVSDGQTLPDSDVDEDVPDVDARCHMAPDPPSGEPQDVDGALLERGFLHTGSGEDHEILKSAQLNALATLIYFIDQYQTIPEVPAVSIVSVSSTDDGLWVEYEAMVPNSIDSSVEFFQDQAVPVTPFQSYERLRLGEVPECPVVPTDPFFERGLYTMASTYEYLSEACRDAIGYTTANLSAATIQVPQCQTFPSYERWFSDCRFNISMIFTPLSDSTGTIDTAYDQMDRTERILRSTSLSFGELDRRQDEPIDGVVRVIYEGTCRNVGGARCVDIEVTLLLLDYDQETQIDPEAPFQPLINEAFERSDVIFWSGHAHFGEVHLPHTLPPENYQMLVLYQCASASHFSPSFFSMKDGLNHDLDLLGFTYPSAGSPELGRRLLRMILKDSRTSHRRILDHLNQNLDDPMILVGGLSSPCE